MSTACDEASEILNCTSTSSEHSKSPAKIEKRPELSISINKLSFNALLDSGASVSAISEPTFTLIKENMPEGQYLSVLPVTGVTISTALQGRGRKVKTQVLLSFSIEGNVTDCIFLVVPHLTTSIIFGDDWLTQNGVQLDYSTRTIHFPQWKLNIPFTCVVNNETKSVHTCFSISISSQDLIITTTDQCLNNVVSVSKFIDNSIVQNVILSSMREDSDERLEILNNIRRHVSIVNSICNDQAEELIELLSEFHHIFRTRPGLNNLYTCRFNVSEDVPFKVRPYPVPFARRPAVDKELQRMIDWGVIERSSSPYSNPILCVAKSDGSVRLCLDARRINRIILPMRDSSPPLDELLARFGGKSIFSSLDFTTGYWQVPLHPDVRKYTAFCYNGRNYQFQVVPFGLNISNTAFQQALEAVLNYPMGASNNSYHEDLHVYVDDVLVSSTSFNEHLIRLRRLFEQISISGMNLKLAKCEFIRQRIHFLGHVITPLGMTMDPSKLKAIHEFPSPRNKKDLQSFVGFCNFYRKFANHHATLISPLIDLLKKNVTWRFGPDELKKFNAVKYAFTERYLSHPDFTKKFYLQTDASGVGLGAELFQVNSIGERQTISFASRALNSAERNYSITELELLSVVFACSKFRVFILGYPIHVITDHQALVFLSRCRMRNARMTRWTLLLQEYDLHIEHIAGPENIIDALSRNPVGLDHLQNQATRPYISSLDSKLLTKFHQEHRRSFQHVIREQRHDPALLKIVNWLTNDDRVPEPVTQHYTMCNDILFYRRHQTSENWLVCIPTHCVDKFIINIHEHYGHAGTKKCFLIIRDICFFHELKSKVGRIIRGCDLCQRAKHTTTRIQGEMQHVMAEAPLACVCVDLYGPLPCGWNNTKYLFVVLD